MNNKKENEKKLLRNLDNILNNYVKMNDEVLEAIIKEDIDKFKNEIGKASTDNFLSIIVEEYDDFTTQLLEKVKERETNNLLALQEEQRRLQEFEKIKGKPVRKTKVKKSKIVKGARNPWTTKEKVRLKLLVKSGVKPKQIIKEINDYRQQQGFTLRTNASIYSQIYRQRQISRDEVSKKELKSFAKEEKMASEEYRKKGFHEQAVDEKNHAEYFSKLAKEKKK